MNDIEKAIKKMKDIEKGKIFNPVALTMHQQIKKRIYTEGKNAKNQKIGNYKPSTLKVRQSKKNRGKVPQSRFIILQFTGQMTRDFIPIKRNGVIIGSGFSNKINDQKVRWIERRLRQKIFAMTINEKNLFESLIQKQVNKIK